MGVFFVFFAKFKLVIVLNQNVFYNFKIEISILDLFFEIVWVYFAKCWGPTSQQQCWNFDAPGGDVRFTMCFSIDFQGEFHFEGSFLAFGVRDRVRV